MTIVIAIVTENNVTEDKKQEKSFTEKKLASSSMLTLSDYFTGIDHL